ncbi:MAG: PEP-CTERM sorting domain-containing protein [Planctomycetes bacterium]|nr:PEP-CTERM sorting domain-containing protein [Planctomycetota bacterium]MBI3833484.1 PEP-CTERM sorting domain-containing protein [Planctomycetota bacterium]
MRKILGVAGIVLLIQGFVSAGVVVSFTRDGQPLAGQGGVGVEPGTNSIGLWLENTSPSTSALSAYLFDFQGGDFSTGRLDASSWQESGAFASLTPSWLPDDQSLNTGSGNFRVSGVTGSLSTPFVGPALPLNTPILIGTFDVFTNAPPGSLVDFVLTSASGIDDEMGRLAGRGITAFGVNDVLVVPEPSILLLFVGGLGTIGLRRAIRKL